MELESIWLKEFPDLAGPSRSVHDPGTAQAKHDFNVFDAAITGEAVIDSVTLAIGSIWVRRQRSARSFPRKGRG